VHTLPHGLTPINIHNKDKMEQGVEMRGPRHLPLWMLKEPTTQLHQCARRSSRAQLGHIQIIEEDKNGSHYFHHIYHYNFRYSFL